MLARKMFRDIRFNLSQFITIFLMVFIGIMAYSGIRSYMYGMTKTADIFYEEQNLQDLEAIAPNFSDKDLEKVRKMEHVKNAERRLTIVGNMDSKKDITFQMNFIERNNISKFYVVDGEDFGKDKKGLWLDEYFANRSLASLFGEKGIDMEIQCDNIISSQKYEKKSEEYLNCYNSDINEVNDENDCFKELL